MGKETHYRLLRGQLPAARHQAMLHRPMDFDFGDDNIPVDNDECVYMAIDESDIETQGFAERTSDESRESPAINSTCGELTFPRRTMQKDLAVQSESQIRREFGKVWMTMWMRTFEKSLNHVKPRLDYFNANDALSEWSVDLSRRGTWEPQNYEPFLLQQA